MIKLGPDNGNSGALIRWGKHLDNGVWFRPWCHRILWTKWNYIPHRYLSLGVVVIQWGNRDEH